MGFKRKSYWVGITPDESSRFPIIPIALVNLHVSKPTVKDLARNQYENEISTLLTPTVINDNWK